MMHEELLAIAPPVSDTLLLPATAVTTGAPPQPTVVTAGIVAIVTPAGSVSVKAAAVTLLPLELEVMVSVEVLPAGMVEGVNALAIDTALPVTT